MADEVDIECPGCSAVFGIPVELCGEMAQCAECNTVFEIPTLDDVPDGDGNLTSTDTGAIKGIEADGEVTNTVRLSRTGIGMIPQIKDDFALGAPASSAASSKKQFTKPSSLSRPPSVPPSAPSAPSVPSAPSAPASAASVPAAVVPRASERIPVPSWTKMRLKKGEDVLGVREVSKSPVGAALMAFIFALGAGAAGIFLKDNLPMAAVAVGGASAVAFIIVFVIAKSGARKALVLTSQRAVCVVGGERLEVKK